jgi:hypothetical protein
MFHHAPPFLKKTLSNKVYKTVNKDT